MALAVNKTTAMGPENDNTNSEDEGVEKPVQNPKCRRSYVKELEGHSICQRWH
jgi:hypothetical protein